MNFTAQVNTNYATIYANTLSIGNFVNSAIELITPGGLSLASPSNPLSEEESSFTVSTEVPLPTLFAKVISANQVIYAGQNATLKGNATGGSGLYAYQWLESYPSNSIIQHFTNSTDCLPSNALSCTFSTNSLTTPGIYAFKLHVTDLATLYTANSSVIYVTVKPPTGFPNSIYSYVPVTITNNQSTATPSGFQQELVFNSVKYQSVEGNNLQNIEFSYANYTIIPSWLETGSVDSASTEYWLKLAPSIPGNSNVTIFMDFANVTTNLLNNVNTGEAPQLQCLSAYDTVDCNYGQYDDGSNIFNIYSNFQGTALGSSWSASNSVNATFMVDNSMIFNRSAVNWCIYNGICYGSSTGYSAIIYDPGIPSGSQYFEAYVSGVFGGGDSNQCNPYPNCFTGLVSTPFYIGELPNPEPSAIGLVYGNIAITAGCNTCTTYYGIENASFANGFNGFVGNTYPNINPWGMRWSSTTSADFHNTELCSNLSAYCTVNPNTVSSPGSTVYPALGILSFIVSASGPGGPRVSNESAIVNWVRSRYVPPNGVMPNATYGTLHRVLGITPSTYTADAGKTVATKFTGVSDNDSITLELDGNVVFTGTYSGTQLVYNISSSLASGVYNLTLIDTTAGIRVSQPFYVFGDPAITITDPVIDQYQYTTLQAKPVNGTGAFTYQWYNDTSGIAVAMPNAIAPTLIVNGSSSGDFYYSVTVNDTAGNYTVSSSNILVTVEPSLNIAISKSNTGSSQPITLTAKVAGGTGNYVYQWYNATDLLLQLPVANQISSTLQVSPATNAIYNYTVLVTDNGTTTNPKWAIESALINNILLQPNATGWTYGGQTTTGLSQTLGPYSFLGFSTTANIGVSGTNIVSGSLKVGSASYNSFYFALGGSGSNEHESTPPNITYNAFLTQNIQNSEGSCKEEQEGIAQFVTEYCTRNATAVGASSIDNLSFTYSNANLGSTEVMAGFASTLSPSSIVGFASNGVNAGGLVYLSFNVPAANDTAYILGSVSTGHAGILPNLPSGCMLANTVTIAGGALAWAANCIFQNSGTYTANSGVGGDQSQSISMAAWIFGHNQTTPSSNFKSYFWAFSGSDGSCSTSASITGSNWVSDTSEDVHSSNCISSPKGSNVTQIGNNLVSTGHVSTTKQMTDSMVVLGANVIYQNGVAYKYSGAVTHNTITFNVPTPGSFAVIELASSAGTFTTSSLPVSCSAVSTRVNIGKTEAITCNSVSTSNTITVTGMNSVAGISLAAFVFPPYGIKFNDTTSGSNIVFSGLTMASNQVYNAIGTFAVNATIPSNYVFNSWSVDSADSANFIIANSTSPDTYITVMGNGVLTAKFSNQACPPDGESYCLPFTLTNNQSTATGTNFVQEFVFNAAANGTHLGNLMQNIAFVNASNSVMPYWIETVNSIQHENSTVLGDNAIIYVKVHSGISAESSIYGSILFYPTTANKFDGVNNGIAPELTGFNADEDSGASVFPEYCGFEGTSLCSSFTSEGGGTITVDNGLTLTNPGTSTYEEFIQSIGTINMPAYTESYIYSGTTPHADYAAWVVFLGQTASNGNQCTINYCFDYVYAGSDNWQIGYDSSTATSITAPNGITSGVIGGLWAATGNEILYYNYTRELAWTDTSNSIGATNIGLSAFSAGGGAITINAYWTRARPLPPNGVMPSVAFGALKLA